MKETETRGKRETGTAKPADTQRALLNVLEDLGAARDKERAEFTRTKVVIETMGSALVTLSPLGVPELANTEAKNIFGWQKGLPTRSLIAQDPFGAVIDLCGMNSDKNCETSYAAGGRQYKTVGRSILIDGRIYGYVLVLTDITREKELDRLKTEFVSVTSHQLRTPLSAIKWIIELMLHEGAGPLTAEQKEFLTQASDSNERMIALIADLLNISRIEAGRLALSPVEVDLSVLTGHVLREFLEKIKEKKLALSTRFYKEARPVVADPKYLHQVLSNLISNAVKYTRPGGRITIAVRSEKGEVVWSISDTGMGIPRAQQDRVFQKFFRGDNVIREETEGTGLGLYVAKSLTEAMGGRIWFTSTEGKGTAFFFALPSKMASKK